MLAVSTRIRYGLRALVAIARNKDEGFVPLIDISAEEHISRKYLENIFKLLKKGNIVVGNRGPEGGYILKRSPEKITVYDVVKALEGPIVPSKCISDPRQCGNTRECGTRDFWVEFQENIENYLRSKTLTQIMEQMNRGDKDENAPCVYG